MKKIIAKNLLEINAVFLSPNKPFTWSSGIKSPIYCDNRLILSYPKIRNLIKNTLAETLQQHFPDCQYIMGTATAGIAHAALVADILELPMGYVRTSSKTHGRLNAIEGKVIKDSRVVVIEDLISTGGSSLKVVKALEEAGFIVLGVLSIFNYNLSEADGKFKDNNVIYKSISDYNTLIEVAVEMNYIDKQDISKLKQWKNNPYNQDWINA
ncbi:orotate phosphoribosyltransferase [Candidatus Izemoplasma sp. B36]|uniref:orotate phosphoribosyltransferase n=1 Tax=Candidatus Izemoplasma sp. B36 TaxID=3242468 RepID=UPI0035565A7F